MAKRKKQPKNSRSAAARKGWETRRLKAEGIELEKSWEGKDKNGKPTGFIYERYTLPVTDKSMVSDIISHVKKLHPGKRFLVAGQADFRDADNRLFTNNVAHSLDMDSKASQKIVTKLGKLLIQPSNPFQTGRSEKVDVEQVYVLIKFEREGRTI